jgi:TATA-box binding protein (TBP) (component of TFIID and TFIIIB)
MPDQKAMGFEDDLHRIDEHLAEARRFVQRQKGLVIRLSAAGVSTFLFQSGR